MPTSRIIESPDFDRIEAGDPKSTRDAVFLLWAVMNDEIKKRIRQIREARDLTEGGVQSVALSVGQNNYAVGEGRILLSTGSTAVTITGFSGGRTGRVLILHVVGTGTITVAHDSASSFTENRILTNTGANVALSTDLTAVFSYLNLRWRMLDIQ